MIRFLAALGCTVLILLGAGGCLPGEGNVDEEKDPHYQRGRSLSSSQDFKGAVIEFEKALETNPRSAAAHFELGWLNDDKVKDFSAAIYHYERYLILRPDSDRADRVKERVKLCKQELAKSEFPIPNSQNLQREVDRLNAENFVLKQQLEALRLQAGGQPAAARADIARAQSSSRPEAVQPRAAAATQPQPDEPQARARTYTIKSGDTIESIAHRYGVKPSAILTANPHVDPRKLRPGQSLNLPSL